MFEFWSRDTGIAVLMTAAAVMILPIQLILCVKAKKLLTKLLPTAVFAAAAIAFYVTAIAVKDWSAFLYLIIAVLSGVLLVFSAIAWGIWAIVRYVKKKN